MKKSILIFLAVICFALTVKAQETSKPIAPAPTAVKPPAPEPTYMIKGLTWGQINNIYQIFNITKESLPYNRRVKDDVVRNALIDIDAFSDFISNNTVPMPTDTAKKPEPAVKSDKKN